MLAGKRILLIIGGGIAAYKALDLIRRLRDAGAGVTPVLTAGGAEFVTPLSVAALAATPVHQDLFDLTREAEMGHIELARATDLVIVAPATADLMAKAAAGLAGDLAGALLLATDRPVLMAPAMNPRMWAHPATQANLAALQARGIHFIGPNAGIMACGDEGEGRLAEPLETLEAARALLQKGPLAGRHVIVTSGPTWEPIDPLRYIANRSSGRQGSAIAAALLALGARVTFVTGPATAPPPQGAKVVAVETAAEMRAGVEAALPADVAICAAAVADWRPAEVAGQKLKKKAGTAAPALTLVENPDILAWLSGLKTGRPALVIGFAAETENLLKAAEEKRRRKGCDWLLANDVGPGTGVMGGLRNKVFLLRGGAPEEWPEQSKEALGRQLATEIATALTAGTK